MKTKKITEEADLQEAFRIRRAIFVEEQKVPLEDEFDEFDSLSSECDHVLVIYDNAPAGTGRIRTVDDAGKLERICILKPYRSFGLGKEIVKGLEEIAAEKELSKVKLHGQTHAEGFYQKLGYETVSDPFMEDGIPHIVMVKEIT
ncbi:GNAT family N-acetyltransferase [Evansella clarkii]|jgi:predicted GNAT family N-acyltransferase|uniref:GNAT family N-acetyltransferase n=1 Tax=Evansella clarkii TaxID=79879 RepID=UPI000996BB85|nr:GNAT family N-acetyltransferase [Evansella clarkii]